MASQNGDILLTIKSLFKGEGFTKADQAIKSTSKSAKTATESIQKVTSALGTMDNKAGRVAGTIGSLFATFAQGGAIGLAIAGVTTAFSFVIDKIEETKKKAEKAAEDVKKAFEEKLSNINVVFQSAKSVNDRQIADAETNAGLLESILPMKAEIARLKEEGKLRRAGMVDENEKKKDQLNENVQVAKLEKAYNEKVLELHKYKNDVDFVKSTQTWIAAKKAYSQTERQVNVSNMNAKNALNEKLRDLRERFAFSGDNADASQRRNKEELEARQKYIEVVKANNKVLQEAKIKLDEQHALFTKAATRDELFKRRQQTEGISKNVEIAEAELAAQSKKTAEEQEKKKKEANDKLIDALEKETEAMVKRADEAMRISKENEKASERQQLEDEKDKKTKETAEEIDKLNKSIKKWEKAANDKARLYDKLGLNEGQGGFGADFKDVILGEGEDIRARQNKLNRDRRNLLGKMDRARAAGGAAWDNWKKNWERLNGNPEKKLEDAQKTRDDLQKQLANDVKAISQKIKELGL